MFLAVAQPTILQPTADICDAEGAEMETAEMIGFKNLENVCPKYASTGTLKDKTAGVEILTEEGGESSTDGMLQLRSYAFPAVSLTTSPAINNATLAFESACGT